ncbi:MAG: helix-turn-helix domain-containing protein [Actinomycetota bacterium]|jgi:sigma-54 dependent transcriptional regulator, acetoin dehydrogenase operon transcriptional activator AcoR
MRSTPSSVEVRAARAAFLSGDDDPTGVRSEIARSWRRSRVCGVDAEVPQLPFFPNLETATSKLYLAAQPILQRCAERLLDANSSIVLADRRARVLGRWSGDRTLDRSLERANVAPGFLLAETVAGTNGIGTVVEEGGPVKIVGREHFAEPFVRFTCVGSPIRHPMTNQIEGVLDIACRDTENDRLLLPMALQIASEIEHELYLHASERERALLESFLREVKTSSRPVVSMSEQFMMANAAAARLLDGTDQVLLWEQASLAVASHRERVLQLVLGDGRPVRARCRPVELDTRTIGVVIELDPGSLGETVARRNPTMATAQGAETMVGQAPAWQQAETLTRRVAPTGLPLLFIGEAGTGKATLARLAHACAARATGAGPPLAVVDCALAAVDGAVAWLQQLKGHFTAGRGSVLLRHVDQLDPATSNALCALVDAASDSGIRLLSTATVAYGSHPEFAQPLLDRLAVVRITIPPLRLRPEDIPLLAAQFVRRHSRRTPLPRFTPEALQAMLRLDWPGNVRQLENLVRALVAGGRLSDIRLEDLPENLRRLTARRPLSRLEQLQLEHILLAIRHAGGNKQLAATQLGISRSTLYRKLRASGIEIDRVLF